MAALTGSERGLPPGSFLNDTIEAGPGIAEVAVVWQPYEDKVCLINLKRGIRVNVRIVRALIHVGVAFEIRARSTLIIAL